MPGVKGITGRPHKRGTVLALEMELRGLHVPDLQRVMACSHRTVYSCLARTRVVRPLEVTALCRLLKCQPGQIVDSDGLLRQVEDSA